MFRRSVTIVLALPLAAVLTAGCSTFSDSSNVARVDDAELTDSDFQAQLTEAGAPTDELLPADAVRAQITTWIQQELTGDAASAVDDDEAAAIYDAGLESAGTTCLQALVVADEAAASRVAGELDGGADFDELFAAENIDESLAASAGDLGCITRDQAAEAGDVEFVQVAASLSADTPLGTSPLVDAQGAEVAWVVLVFRPFAELSPADLEGVTAAIAAAARLANADIWVDPRYGTFDTGTGQVIPLS